MNHDTKIINVHFPGRRNWWLLFGSPRTVHPVSVEGLASTAELLSFVSGSLFGVSHQTLNEYGITDWEVWILRAVSPGEEASLIPGIRPGAQILLYAHGQERAKTILRYLDILAEKQLDPATLPHLHRNTAPYLERGVIPHELIEKHFEKRGAR